MSGNAASGLPNPSPRQESSYVWEGEVRFVQAQDQLRCLLTLLTISCIKQQFEVPNVYK